MMMRTYRIVLNSFGVVFVEAESYTKTESLVAFYRANLISAEYPCAMVREVIEVIGQQGWRHERMP